MSNSQGSYCTTPQRSMTAFDKLPAAVRIALSESVADWAVQPILTKYRLHGVKEETLVSLITHWNRSELIQRERDRAAARGVYRVNVPEQPGQKRVASGREF